MRSRAGRAAICGFARYPQAVGRLRPAPPESSPPRFPAAEGPDGFGPFRALRTFRAPRSNCAAMTPPLASLGSDVSQFLDSVGTFFSNLAGLSWGPLLLALLCYAAYLTLRSRALFNAVQAAYPAEHVRWRDVWGAYVAGVGINQVFPLGGGTLVQYFLTRISIPASSYPAIIAAIWTGLVFDWASTCSCSRSRSRRASSRSRRTSRSCRRSTSPSSPRTRASRCSSLTALAIGVLVAFALLSASVKAFWARVRQGFTILPDRRRYLREMVTLAVGRLARALRRVLVPARRLPHRRLGAQRAARARRPGRRDARAVHTRRRGRAAGAAVDGLRAARARSRPSRSASRSRSRVSRSAMGFAALV